MNYRTIGGAWFVVWLVAVSIPLTYATSLHTLPLPTANVAAQPMVRAGEHWSMTHIVAGGCPCSKVIVEHLAERAGPRR